MSIFFIIKSEGREKSSEKNEIMTDSCQQEKGHQLEPSSSEVKWSSVIALSALTRTFLSDLLLFVTDSKQALRRLSCLLPANTASKEMPLPMHIYPIQ